MRITRTNVEISIEQKYGDLVVPMREEEERREEPARVFRRDRSEESARVVEASFNFPVLFQAPLTTPAKTQQDRF